MLITLNSDSPGFLARHLSLRQLQVFEAVARLGGYTRAAESLHLTQPTVSMQLKKLSDTIGLPLFDQAGKKLYLSDAGRTLYQACVEVSDSLERLEMQISDMKGLKQGRLRLALVTTIESFAPRCLGHSASSIRGGRGRVSPAAAVVPGLSQRQAALHRGAGLP